MTRLLPPVAILLAALSAPTALRLANAQTPAFEAAPVQAPPVQPAIKDMTLAQLIATPASQAAVVLAAKGQFTQSPGACAAAQFSPTGETNIFQLPAFGADGKPYVGAWTESVKVAGCGAERLLNVLTIAHADGEPVRVALMPGTSHADPVTQKAALQYAQAVASRSPPPGCRQLAFTDARFLKYDGSPNPEVRDGRDARPWSEDWFVVECGNTYSINIRFKPNATGTQLAGSNPVKR